MTKPLDLASVREAKASLPVIDLLTLPEDPPAREWILPDYIPVNSATYLTGAGSAGKSLLAQQLCTALAAGVPFLGIEAGQCPTIYLTCEDAPDELHRRQNAINRALGTGYPALARKLHLVSLVDQLDNALGRFNDDGTLRPSDLYDKLLSTAHLTASRLIVLDNVAHLFAGNENDRHHVAAFVGLLNRLAIDIAGGVLLIGHPNKSGAAFSGSTAWENQVRSRLFLEVPVDPNEGCIDRDARKLSRGKSNYAANGESIEFRWHEWAYVRPVDLPEDLRTEIAANFQATHDNEVFLACLRELTRRQQGVSDNVSARTYAPSVFAQMPEAKGVSKARLVAAMDRLFRIDAIERGFLWRHDRKDRFGLREKCADPRADPAITGRADPALTPR